MDIFLYLLSSLLNEAQGTKQSYTAYSLNACSNSFLLLRDFLEITPQMHCIHSAKEMTYPALTAHLHFSRRLHLLTIASTVFFWQLSCPGEIAKSIWGSYMAPITAISENLTIFNGLILITVRGRELLNPHFTNGELRHKEWLSQGHTGSLRHNEVLNSVLRSSSV